MPENSIFKKVQFYRPTYQNKCPHMLTTASLAVSRQILHSNILSSFSFSSPLLFLEKPAAAILVICFVELYSHCKTQY